jgi:hypothetical protein
MLSILRHAVLPARRELFPVRALSVSAPLLEAAARKPRAKKVKDDAAVDGATKPKKAAAKPKKLKIAGEPSRPRPRARAR